MLCVGGVGGCLCGCASYAFSCVCCTRIASTWSSSRFPPSLSSSAGTITKSDIRGYIHSVHLGSHHHTHQGIGRLFSHLEQVHCLRFVYLTSRPLSLLDATRTYLANVEQEEGYRLPQGPVFTSMDSLTRVLYKVCAAGGREGGREGGRVCTVYSPLCCIFFYL